MTGQEVARRAEEVLRSLLGSAGLERVTVIEDLDSTNDPAFFVNAFLKPGSKEVGGDLVTRAHRALSQTLVDAGEDRFPYLRLRYPDDEEAEVGSGSGLPDA